MPITYKLKPHEGLKFNSYQIYANGRKLRAFTDLTGEEAVKRFCALAEPHCELFAGLAAECEEAVQTNIKLLAAGHKGKRWPCFDQFERLWKKIQKQANIQDT